MKWESKVTGVEVNVYDSCFNGREYFVTVVFPTNEKHKNNTVSLTYAEFTEAFEKVEE